MRIRTTCFTIFPNWKGAENVFLSGKYTEEPREISTVQTPREKQNNRFDFAREFMYSIHLITAAQADSGVRGGEKKNPHWGLLQVCLLSEASVKVRCELQPQQRGVVQWVYRQKLWPISWSWILNRLVDVKCSCTLQATNRLTAPQKGRGGRQCVSRTTVLA